MTWVKICGITNLEDALVAVDAGADALGFVFYEKSPRKVAAPQVRDIVSTLPRQLEKVGVFVMKTAEEMKAVADEAELTAWQLHKDFNGTPLQQLLQEGGFFALPKLDPGSGKKVYVSLPANVLLDDDRYRGMGWAKGADSTMSALFIDSGHGSLPGGTGQTFDWRQFQPAMQPLSMHFKVVVAGGLTPENVTEAISILHPWGVDVSSGVEARPGKKDPEKVRAFIKAVRDYDKANSRN
jgi:phosphoribosylanthranilate isomerase